MFLIVNQKHMVLVSGFFIVVCRRPYWMLRIASCFFKPFEFYAFVIDSLILVNSSLGTSVSDLRYAFP